MRYAVGATFWLPWVLHSQRTNPANRGIWRAALGPAAANTTSQVGFALSPYYVDAGIMGFLLEMSFLFTIVIGFLLLRDERRLARHPLFWSGSLSLIAGVMAIYLGGWGHSAISAIGMVILLITTVCGGAYLVLIRTSMQQYPVQLSFGVVSIYTAITLLVLMALFGDWGQLAVLAGRDWGWLVLSAILGIAFAHVLLYQMIRSLGPIVSAGGICLVPLVTAAGAYGILGEMMTPLQWTGGTIMLLGCFCLVFAKMHVDLPSGSDNR